MSAAEITDPVLLLFATLVGTNGPVAVEGSRTRWTLGGPSADDVRLVRAPAGIVAYKPEEMTLQVRAGTSVAEVHATLAEAGQRTALPERGGSVGGAIAVGENALQVLGRGRLRASVLQVRYVSAEGRLVTAGGPTVKNVTGFDLPRLLTGSLGTLGLIGELILRTNPIPAVSRWLRSSDADQRASLRAALRPSVVLWDGGSVWVQLEGHAEDVELQHRSLASIGSFEEVEGPPALPAHRWSLEPTALESLTGGSAGQFVASIGVGTVWASVPQPRRQLPADVVALSERVKATFDPTGRLNPGRAPWRS